jgi:glycosyltransferase involved in cell wall biosynthesis
MSSIIIPAHNESAVIGRCLTALTRDAVPGEFEIIVVCNGCVDRTADVARGFGPQVTVIETPVASKSNALNLGDQAAHRFPRFYVDADVVVTAGAIREVAEVLAGGRALAAAPRMEVDLADRRWAVRAFYRVWMRLPYCRKGMIGSGVYGLSDEGRKRFGEFPAITADDGFARLQFSDQERMTVESCRFTVTPPKTLSGLIAVKTRSHFGNLELKARYPSLWSHEEADHEGALKSLAWRPLWWPALGVYAGVKWMSRLRATWRFRYGDHRKWERDDTSRDVPGLSGGTGS